MIRILIPTPLRAYTDKKSMVELEATTVQEALEKLMLGYPKISKHILNNQGKLRSFINIYLKDEDIRFLQKEQTPLQDGDTLSILPSIAGGSV